MTARINTPFRNYFFYKSGVKIKQPLTDGFIYFYENDNRTPAGLLTVYQDPELTIPYANPLQLDSDGGCPPIYLQDAVYYIEVWSCEDGTTPDQLEFDIEDYEGAVLDPGGSGDNYTIDNFFEDGQFDLGDFDGEPTAGITTIAESGWVFQRDGTGGGANLQFVRFSLGDDDVINTPLNSLHYQVGTTPSPVDTVSRFYMPFKYVRTLEGIELTISFYARSNASTVITPFYEQFFGTGGSPSPTNTVTFTPIALTGTWTAYSQTFTVDSAAGKELGSNGDDALRVGINFPLNIIMDVYVTNMLLEEGPVSHQYPYLTYNLIGRNSLIGKVFANPTDLLNGVPRTLSEKLLAGTGLTITSAVDNSTLTISANGFAGTKFISQSVSADVDTTTAATASPSSGVAYLTLTYTPISASSYLRLTAYSPGATAANNQGLMWITDDTTNFNYAFFGDGSVSNGKPCYVEAIIANTTLTPKTFKLRYGSASGSQVWLFKYPGGAIPAAQITLMVEEFLQQT